MKLFVGRVERIKVTKACMMRNTSVYLVGDGLIHGQRLRKGYMRVSVLKGLPNTPVICVAAKSTLPKKIQGLATSAAAKCTLPKSVQGPATECSKLAIVPAITRASKKRKKTTKAPIEQSKDKKEKADIRKRLHLLKDDIDDRSYAVKKGYQQWMAREDCAMSQLVNFKKEIFRMPTISLFRSIQHISLNF
nr:ulp1 protease family, C-terminal catalytic domain-containing protein [Tanacetum cinerariifolium]